MNVKMLSPTEYWRTAEYTPIGSATSQVKPMAESDTTRVRMRRSRISSETGTRQERENPKSPRAKPHAHLR